MNKIRIIEHLKKFPSKLAFMNDRFPPMYHKPTIDKWKEELEVILKE